MRLTSSLISADALGVMEINLTMSRAWRSKSLTFAIYEKSLRPLSGGIGQLTRLLDQRPRADNTLGGWDKFCHKTLLSGLIQTVSYYNTMGLHNKTRLFTHPNFRKGD